MSHELEDALRNRAADPDRAMDALRSSAATVRIDDPGVLFWIGQRCQSVIPEDLQPIFHRSLEGPSEARRLALQTLGSTAWTEGRPEDAERCWNTAAKEGDGVRDRLWRIGLNNMSLMRLVQGRHFETLALAGTVLRSAPEVDRGVTLFSHSMRAGALLELDVDEAHNVLDMALAQAKEGTQGVSDNLRSMKVSALSTSGRWEDAEGLAIEAIERQSGATRPATLITLRVKLNRVRYELYPESRSALLAELASMPDELHIAGSWRRLWKRALHLTRWRYALEHGDALTAETEATGFLDSCADQYSATTMADALRVLEDHPADAPGHRALLARAADLVLQRFADGQTVRDHPAATFEATADDWEIFARYQKRLLHDNPPLRTFFASRWKPGLPAYDQLALDGPVTQCAWCGCLKSGGSWVAEDVTKVIEPKIISHGICDRCTAQFEN